MDRTIIAKVQGLGFDVYMRNPEKDSWLIFTDGSRLGYLQSERGNGMFTLCTVHKPNRNTGTGFSIARDAGNFNRDDLEKCFSYAPAWAYGSDRATVVKYRDIEDFRKADKWNAGYQLVDKIAAA